MPLGWLYRFLNDEAGNELMPVVLTGIGWHMVGAASAASFYAPIEKVKKWSWETTWAVAGFFSWILLPIGVSLLLLPHFGAFYCVDPDGRVVEGGTVRGHVGRWQCELRPDHAVPGHVAWDRRGDRSDAGGGHARSAVDARAGGALLSPRRSGLLQHGGRGGGADRRGHRVVCGTPERRAVEDRRARRVQRDARACGWR